MSSQEKQEKKNNRIGLITSLGIHAALLLLFLFAMAWRAPDPPLPEFGIVINVGFDEEGSGDVQTDKPATEPETQDEPQQDVQEEPTQPVVEDKPVEQIVQPEVIPSKIESPVVVKEEKVKVKDEPKPKEPEKVQTEYKKEEPKQAQKQNEKTGEKTESEGDDKDKTGNKGQPDGKLDEAGLYKGKPGGGAGGDGVSLSMSGWKWAEDPQLPKLPDNEEDGKVVFEIECDADGEIVGIKTLERTLSPKAEQLLKEMIRNSSLMRTAGTQAPERSKGTVVFSLKSK